MDDALDEREPPDNRFSDLREGVRGKEENRFKFAVNVERRCRGVDEGLVSSPISFGNLGGDRELERLNKLGPESTDIPISSEVGVSVLGISSGVMLTQLSSLFIPSPSRLKATESSLERGGSMTVGGGTSFALMRPTSSMAFPTSATKSSIDPFGGFGFIGDDVSDPVEGAKAPSRTWTDVLGGWSL